VRNVTDRTSNPFGMRPDCERFVPGYGDANADFHVVGDSPRVHGGADTGVPFTNDAGRRLQDALVRAGLLREAGDEPGVDRTFLSYLDMCVRDRPTTEAEYADMDRFFDAEVRAIAAHVLLPIGARATTHVFETFTARRVEPPLDMEALHATEVLGSGWLVVPVREPAEWDDAHADRLVAGLDDLRSTDFRREADLGRFLSGGESYHVR